MRKSRARRVLISAALAAVVVIGMGATAPPSPAWETMKSLQGEWDGLYGGKMKTMYHPDGNGLVMTHYCSENTQSRMRAAGSDTKRIVFSFLDATNAASPDAMRMTGLVLTVKDHDHMTAEWTSSGMGKSGTGLFEFTRRK